MTTKVKLFILLGVTAFVALIVTCSVFGFVKKNAEDFVFEQNPTASSLGELIGSQYSQLRELAASLNANSCKIEQNLQAQEELRVIYGPAPEGEWVEDARAEARSLRWENQALLRVHTNLARDFNVLRSDVRTIADNLGLNVDVVEVKQNYSVDLYPCNGSAFQLPE